MLLENHEIKTNFLFNETRDEPVQNQPEKNRFIFRKFTSGKKKTNSQIIFLINEISFQLRMQIILKLMICEDHFP